MNPTRIKMAFWSALIRVGRYSERISAASKGAVAESGGLLCFLKKSCRVSNNLLTQDMENPTRTPEGQAQKSPNWFMRHKVFTGIVVAVVVLVVLGSGEENKTNNDPGETAPSSSTEKPLNYEVVEEIPGGTTLVMRVYTTEKDSEKLIRLTDKLFNEHKDTLTHLTIDYFDDKQLAVDYFSKVSDEKLSETEKEEMASHYVAGFYYNTTSGYKALKQKDQNGDWVELKKY